MAQPCLASPLAHCVYKDVHYLFHIGRAGACRCFPRMHFSSWLFSLPLFLSIGCLPMEMAPVCVMCSDVIPLPLTSSVLPFSVFPLFPSWFQISTWTPLTRVLLWIIQKACPTCRSRGLWGTRPTLLHLAWRRKRLRSSAPSSPRYHQVLMCCCRWWMPCVDDVVKYISKCCWGCDGFSHNPSVSLISFLKIPEIRNLISLWDLWWKRNEWDTHSWMCFRWRRRSTPCVRFCQLKRDTPQSWRGNWASARSWNSSRTSARAGKMSRPPTRTYPSGLTL